MSQPVFREMEIGWRGETYVFTPSNRLLRRLEGEGISFPKLIEGVASGAPAVGQISFVISEFLKAGGCTTVTEDDVYDEIMTSLANGEEDAFLRLAEVVIEAISPKGLDEKKPGGQDGRAKKKRPSRKK